MPTNVPSCFSVLFLEQLLKFLVNFTLLKYVKSQRNYGFLITKELIFGFQILDLKDHFSASLSPSCDVTIFDKGAQNAQFSFRIFSQDFRDFESSYLWNENRYQQTVKSFLFGF